MQTTTDQKFNLTVLTFACYAAYIYFGYKALFKLDPFDEVPIIGEIYMYGSFIYGGIMMWNLIHLYCNELNPKILVKTAIIGLLIIPLIMAAFVYVGVIILIALFLLIAIRGFF